MNREADPFAHAEHTARVWLEAVMRHLDTQDRRYAYRVLRAWLHVVRDRLTVDAAVHLGAQLPEILRGIYYEGWRPSSTPRRYDRNEFIERYAADAGIAPTDVPRAVTRVGTALQQQFSPGGLDHVLDQLPPSVQRLLWTGESSRVHADGETRPTLARLDRLEHLVESLTDMVARIGHRLDTAVGTPAEPLADMHTTTR